MVAVIGPFEGDPTAQTRAATGNKFGPVKNELLSSPTTFQVMGVTVSAAIAELE